MTMTPRDYLTANRTNTQQAFLDWVIAETGVQFKTGTAREAFALGLFMGNRTYGRFQAANREAAAKVKPAKATPKPRAKKAAAK